MKKVHWIALSSVAVLGLAVVVGVGLFARSELFPTNREAVKPQTALASQAPRAERSTSLRPQPISDEMKALFAKLHPGMDVSELMEPPVDVMKLSMPERRDRLDRGIAAYEDEARDEIWAPQHEARISTEFETLTEDSFFFLANVECRQTYCLATLGWEDAKDGPSVYDTVTSTPLGAGCLIEVLPPEEGAQEARVLMDCASQRKRAEGAVPMVALHDSVAP